MRPKFQKQSELKLAGRIIQQSKAPWDYQTGSRIKSGMTGRYMVNSEQDRTSGASAGVLSNGGSAAVAAAVAHIMVDFMGMSVWPVYKTLAGLDVAKAGWIATGGGNGVASLLDNCH